jgi:hypothetical protein
MLGDMDDLTVRHMSDDELIDARSGGPLESYGTQRADLPRRSGRPAQVSRRQFGSRPQPDQATTPTSES